MPCREEHPELMEERKKSELPEKPKTPQQLWYNHEKKAYMKLHPEVHANTQILMYKYSHVHVPGLQKLVRFSKRHQVSCLTSPGFFL